MEKTIRDTAMGHIYMSMFICSGSNDTPSQPLPMIQGPHSAPLVEVNAIWAELVFERFLQENGAPKKLPT
jgi:hypothetical protein